MLSRIIHERGSVVNITESELENEIQSPVDPQQGETSELEEEVGTVSEASQNEKFYRDKNEVLKHIGIALNESSLSLDFVSLLISCVRPAAGTISMSAHLKKFIPPGSLNSDIVANGATERSKEEKYRDEKMIGQGWKLSSLETSSETLHNAGARLSEEVHREKLFWDVIKKNFNNKEILYKTRDKHSGKRLFAVKYGYEDSGSNYKVKGNALLKPVDDHLEFIPMGNANNGVNKVVRVRIIGKQDGEDDVSILGESKVEGKFQNDGTIRSQIEKARFFIFEEELFTQLSDEAVGLVAYNLKVESEDKMTIEAQEHTIEIEYVDYEESEEQDSIQQRPENTRAELFATYLRLMLSLRHKANLESKKQPQVLKSATSIRSQSKPQSPILKPLAGHFKHEEAVQQLYGLLHTLAKEHGGVLKLKRYSNVKGDDAFERILKAPMTTFQIHVRDLRVTLVLDSYDFVNTRIHIRAFNRGKTQLNIDFEELVQLEECLVWLIEMYGS